jgi:hypothetical protein
MSAPENMYNNEAQYIQTESLMAIIDQDLTSSAVAESIMMVNVDELLVSNALATDEFPFDVITSLISSALATDHLQTAETTLLTSSLNAKDTIYATVSFLLTDSATVSDEIAISRDYLLSNTAFASDELVPLARYFQLEIANAVINDAIQPGQAADLVSSAMATDAIDPGVSYYETVISVANITDELDPWRVTFELLVSSAAGDDEITFDGSVYSETLMSTALARDELWAKDFSAIAWVMNTQTGGLSNYSNFEFNSLAFHNGKLYGTSREGLSELDADKDDGRNINSIYKGGFLDFGTEHKKRISDVYIGYTGGGLECDIETADKQVYTYEMEAREGNLPHNSRLKPGRGLSSRHWRFAFRNIDGADFQIQDIIALVGVSKRRL